MITELAILASLALTLAIASVVTLQWIVKNDQQSKKLSTRMAFIASPLTAPDPLDEQISLAKAPQKSEKIKTYAAELVNVDLNQAETYPVKWWLIPPLTIAAQLGDCLDREPSARAPIFHGHHRLAFLLACRNKVYVQLAEQQAQRQAAGTISRCAEQHRALRARRDPDGGGFAHRRPRRDGADEGGIPDPGR